MKKIFVALAVLMFAFPIVAYATPNHDQNGDHTKSREIAVHLASDVDTFSVNEVDFVCSSSKYKSVEKFKHSPISIDTRNSDDAIDTPIDTVAAKNDDDNRTTIGILIVLIILGGAVSLCGFPN